MSDDEVKVPLVGVERVLATAEADVRAAVARGAMSWEEALDCVLAAARGYATARRRDHEASA